MNLLLAIDPGASGGIAWYDGTLPFVEPMPETEGDVLALLRSIITVHAESGATAHVEKVGGYIGGAGSPGSAMFGFGRGVGFLYGVLMAHEIPIIEVTPQRWQKTLGMGTREHARPEKGMAYSRDELRALAAQDARLKGEWKNRLKAEAQRRFPGLKVTLKTADALLILAAAMEGGRA